MINIKKENRIQCIIFIYVLINGKGKIKVISISKIRNIKQTEKKCTEKEIRGLEKGSNPHSKGEGFSRSRNLWILIIGMILIIEIKTTFKIIIIYIDKIIILSLDFLSGN